MEVQGTGSSTAKSRTLRATATSESKTIINRITRQNKNFAGCTKKRKENIMKTSKIFASVFAAVAMLTTNATQALADMYHAEKVYINVGWFGGSNFSLTKIGETADSCEVWAGFNTTDQKSYFWCYIDGNRFSRNGADIPEDQTLPLLPESKIYTTNARCITSNSQDLHLVKVKSSSSDENLYMTLTSGHDSYSDSDTWGLWDVKTTVSPQGTPEYDAATNTYTQDVTYTAASELFVPNNGWKYPLFYAVNIYAYYDGNLDGVKVGEYSSGISLHQTVKVTLEGGHRSVRYLAMPMADATYRPLTPKGCGGWPSDLSESYTFGE